MAFRAVISLRRSGEGWGLSEERVGEGWGDMVGRGGWERVVSRNSVGLLLWSININDHLLLAAPSARTSIVIRLHLYW